MLIKSLVCFYEPLQAVADIFCSNHRDAVLAGDNYHIVLSLCYGLRFNLMSGYNLPILAKECISFATQLVSVFDILDMSCHIAHIL